MGIIPTLIGFFAGEKVTAEKLTLHTKGALEATVYNKPFCKMTAISTQPISHSTTGLGGNSVVALKSVVQDTDTMADTTNNRVTIQTAGTYRITAQIVLGTAANGANAQRFMGIVVKVGTVIAMNSAQGGGAIVPSALNATVTTHLDPGDNVFVVVGQTDATTLSTTVDWGGCFLEVEWMSNT